MRDKLVSVILVFEDYGTKTIKAEDLGEYVVDKLNPDDGCTEEDLQRTLQSRIKQSQSTSVFHNREVLPKTEVSKGPRTMRRFIESSGEDRAARTDVSKVDYYLNEIKSGLIKLHEESKKCGISLMSIAIAAERAKMSINTVSARVTSSQITAMGLFEMGPDGKVGEIVNTESELTLLAMRKLFGKERDKDMGRVLDSLEDACEQVGIALVNETAILYGQDFIDSISN